MIRPIDRFADELLDGAPFLETITGVELRPSSIQGRGMFATRAWSKGEVLCVLDGQVIPVERCPAVIDALEWNALSEDRLLVRPIRTSYGFINHGEDPNVVIDTDGRTMRARRDIAIDEELTLDYFAEPVPPAYLRSDEAAALRPRGR